MSEEIKSAAFEISKAKTIAALTGAGISVESGIPPFRGSGSIWDKIDPMEYAHINSLKKDPEKVWKFFLGNMKRIIDKAMPNDAHNGLSKLEEMGRLGTIITQNIDGLHQMAGSSDVIEFHGSLASHSCMECGFSCKTTDLDISQIPPRCNCGGVFRPDCIFFGEMIPEDTLWRAGKSAENCDLMIVVGTSAVVQPAASMPVIAKDTGAKIIEINMSRTELTSGITDIFLEGSAGVILNKLIAELEKLV